MPGLLKRLFRTQTLSRIKRIYAITWSASPPAFVGTLALTALAAFATGALAVSLRMLVDGAIRGELERVIIAGVIAGLAQGTDSAGGLVKYNLQVVLTARAAILFERQVVELTAKFPWLEHMEQPSHFDKVAYLRDQGRVLADTCWAITESVALFVNVLISVVLLISVHPALALLPLFAIPTLTLAGRTARMTSQAEMTTQAPMRLERELTDLIVRPGPAKETRISGSDAVFAQRADELWQRAVKTQSAARARAAMLALPGWLLFAAGYVGALFLVIVRLLNGAGTPGDILLVVALANRVRGQVRQGSERVRQLSTSLDVIEEYEWLAEVSAPPSKERFNEPAPDRIREGIQVKDVSFRYPGTDREVLGNVNLDLPAGSVVALVGENGAGKTTLVKLLSRLYDPTEGQILVDGKNLSNIEPDQWREGMSAAFQDFYKFQILAREAVGAGDLPRIDDEEAIRAAVTRADADFLDQLPNALDTRLGTQFAGGVDLSGGQWQRVALARMTMRDDPLLLVLDEPTAALDAFAESQVFDRYIGHGRRLAEETGAITLLVTHRFATVRDADMIVVLQEGRIVDQGTHAELMSRDGLYKELYSLQESGYR